MKCVKARPFIIVSILMIFLLFEPERLFAAEPESWDEMYEMSVEELLAIEVSIATRFPMASNEAPSIISVVTAVEIRNMGAENIIDILRTVPGFDLTHMIQRDNHQGSVRGMNPKTLKNSVVFLVNGHRFGAGCYTGGPGFFFDVIPIDNIKKIEIIRGPGSALYGSEAFNGVINIITKEGGDASSRLSAKAGSFNTHAYAGEFSYGKEAFKFYLFGEYYTTDGSAEMVESDFATRQFGPAGSAAPGRTTESKTYYTFFTDIDYQNYYFNGYFQQLNTEIPIGLGKALTDEDDIDLFYMYVDLGASFAIKEKGNLDVRMHYDHSDEVYLQEVLSEETGALMGLPPGESLFAKPSRKNANLGAEISIDYNIFPGLKAVAGASYESIELFDVVNRGNYNLTGAPLEIDGTVYAPNEFFGEMLDISENGNYAEDRSREIAAVYGQATVDMKELLSLGRHVENMSVTTGVRYDHYSDVQSSITPRLGVVYAPTKKLYFKALYGKGFNAPEFVELHVKNNPVALGNPGLKPEKITTIEGLVGYNFSERLKTSATIYHNEARDIVDFKDGVTQNIGKTKSYGLELELKAGLDNLKYLYANATWQHVKNTTRETIVSEGGQTYTQEAFFPGNVPTFIANIGVNYDIFDWMIANASFNYVGERTRSEEKIWAGETLVGLDDRAPVSDRLLLNATLTFRKFYKGLEAQISGWNLLDQDHRDPVADGSIENDQPRPGARFMVRISYLF